MSRSDAIFEFSSSDSNISLSVAFECRNIELLRPESTNNTSLFTFVIGFYMESLVEDGGCVERGLNDDWFNDYWFNDACTTAIEGE